MTRAARSAMRGARYTLRGQWEPPSPSRSCCWRSCSARASRSTRTTAAAPKPPRPRRRLPIATIEAPRRGDPRTCASATLPQPAEVSPAQAQARRPRGPRPLLPRRAGATPTRRCSSCSGCSSPASTCARCRPPIFGQGVAGYYDPRTKRLRVVSGAQTENRVLNEITLAHELTHALEDQRFKLDLESSSSDDAGMANLALVEGSATAVMFTYAERHFSPEQTLGGLFSSLGQDTGDLPPFVEAQLVFPYIQGQRVHPAALRDRRRQLVAGRLRLPLPPARLDRADHAPRQVPAGRAARPGAGCTRSPGAGWAPGRGAAPGASGRPAS